MPDIVGDGAGVDIQYTSSFSSPYIGLNVILMFLLHQKEGLEWSVVEGTQEDVESTWSLRVDSARPKGRSASLNTYLDDMRQQSR